MSYAEKKLDDAMKFYETTMEAANYHLPSDSWLSPARAEKANAQWQEMMKSMSAILRLCAEEKQQWPPETAI